MASEKTKKIIASAKAHVAMAKKTITGADAHVAETKYSLRTRSGVNPENTGSGDTAAK